ncbi:neuronal growth regulator 1 [Sarcophilus harrisii]
MDIMMLVQGACCSNQWLAAVLLSLCCLLPSCLPAGQSMDLPWPAVDNLMVRKGDTAVLRCYLEDGASKGAWLNRSSIIFAGGDKWSVDPRVSISTLNKRDYSLQIQNVDVTDDGPYTCSVQTQHTPRTMQVHLTVQVAPTIQEIKSGTVAPGRSGLIRCEGAGVPPPAFEWYKGEKKLFNGQQGIVIQNFSTRSILTVTNVTQEHFGNYTCVAANKLGTTNASLPLNPPSTAQYGITGSAEVLFSCWSLVLSLPSLTSILYLKDIILQ